MIEALNDVPAFVVVVEAGGFSAAAGKLHVSRSAVGKAVARLEGRLGVRLFHRTTRSQSLTEDGQAFYERCRRALDEVRAGAALLDSGRKTVSGKLRVSIPVLFGRLCVAPVLTRLAAIHPELEIELNFSDRPIDLIEDGFDLAVRNGPLGEPSGLMSRRVGQQRTLVFASPSYIDRHGAPGTLDDLNHHAAIVYARGGRVLQWRFPCEGAAPLDVRPPARLRFDDLGAIADAAVAGFGLAWLPSWLVREELRSGALVRLLVDAPALVSDSYAIWPQTPHLPMRVRVAVDALADEVPGRSAA